MKSLLLVGLALVLQTSSLQASTITYTFMGIASGALNGTPFTNQQVTLVGVADTANITTAGGFPFMPLTSETVSVASIGGDTITSAMSIAFLGVQSAAIGNRSGAATLAAIFYPGGLTGYDLVSSFGPVAGQFAFGTGNNGTTVTTTLGSFNIAGAPGGAGSITFSAVLRTSSAPEPASFGMITLGLMGMAAALRRSRSKS